MKKEVKKEEEEDIYKWWEQESSQANNEEQDESIKWTTLQHNGVLFPPDYEPHGVKMKYDGKSITLSPEAEEVASFFAALLESDHAKNPTFQKNFFRDWQAVLKKDPRVSSKKRKKEKAISLFSFMHNKSSSSSSPLIFAPLIIMLLYRTQR